MTWTLADAPPASSSTTAAADFPTKCTPDPAPTPADISIFVTCVANGATTYDAIFGFRNAGESPVSIPVGPQNRFDPDPLDRGQPAEFVPGTVSVAVTVRGIANGTNLKWTILPGNDSRVGSTVAEANPGFGTKCGPQLRIRPTLRILRIHPTRRILRPPAPIRRGRRLRPVRDQQGLDERRGLRLPERQRGPRRDRGRLPQSLPPDSSGPRADHGLPAREPPGGVHGRRHQVGRTTRLGGDACRRHTGRRSPRPTSRRSAPSPSRRRSPSASSGAVVDHGDTYDAVFGLENDNPVDISVQVGVANFVLPKPRNAASRRCSAPAGTRTRSAYAASRTTASSCGLCPTEGRASRPSRRRPRSAATAARTRGPSRSRPSASAATAGRTRRCSATRTSAARTSSFRSARTTTSTRRPAIGAAGRLPFRHRPVRVLRTGRAARSGRHVDRRQCGPGGHGARLRRPRTRCSLVSIEGNADLDLDKGRPDVTRSTSVSGSNTRSPSTTQEPPPCSPRSRSTGRSTDAYSSCRPPPQPGAAASWVRAHLASACAACSATSPPTNRPRSSSRRGRASPGRTVNRATVLSLPPPSNGDNTDTASVVIRPRQQVLPGRGGRETEAALHGLMRASVCGGAGGGRRAAPRRAGGKRHRRPTARDGALGSRAPTGDRSDGSPTHGASAHTSAAGDTPGGDQPPARSGPN